MQDFLKRYWWLIAAFLMLIVFAFSLLEPPPPKKVTMAAGSQGGAYMATSEKYKGLLSDDKVTLDILETKGSVDNLQKLLAGEADIAILQTGIAEASHSEALYSLGAVYFEPLWVFHRAGMDVQDLRDLTGATIAVGAEGSGARALSDLILAENELGASNATLVSEGGRDAATALLSGQVDAALLVAGPEASWVRDLVADPAVELYSMQRALAYARRYPYLKDVVLPDGALDLSADLPEQDVSLVAPSAQIVVRKDLHPAIHAVLLEAMNESHGGGTLLSAPKTFPNPVLTDLPLSSEAKRYYERGPSFLRRYFSFAMANFLDRAWVLLIPLATLAVPIVRAGPPLYRWRIRRRIYVWYRDLRLLEEEGRSATSVKDRHRVRAELAKLQEETGKVIVPDSYTDDLYRLRAHIRFVAELLDKLGEEDAAARI